MATLLWKNTKESNTEHSGHFMGSTEQDQTAIMVDPREYRIYAII